MLRSLMMGLIVVIVPVCTQASQPMLSNHGSDIGFYLGGGAGQTNLNLSSTAFGNAGSKTETGFKVTGGWQFHPFLAAELSYYNPGEFTERDGNDALKVTADIVEASLVGTTPIVGNLFAFGRVGVARWDGKLDATIDGDSGSFSDTGNVFNWEVGLQFAITPHFRLRSSYEQAKIDTNIADVLPVTWRFRFYQVAALYQF